MPNSRQQSVLPQHRWLLYCDLTAKETPLDNLCDWTETRHDCQNIDREIPRHDISAQGGDIRQYSLKACYILRPRAQCGIWDQVQTAERRHGAGSRTGPRDSQPYAPSPGDAHRPSRQPPNFNLTFDCPPSTVHDPPPPTMAPPTPRLLAPSPSPSSSFSQLTYNLPHAHIYTSKFYPRPLASRPTTLSEVLVYGHESGITVLWRAWGGSKKTRKDVSLKSKAPRNDAEDDAMALDDDDATNKQESEVDVSEEEFACSYNIHLGTPVHHISFPPASILPSDFDALVPGDEDEEEDLLKALPNNLLQKNMLIAAACGDRAIRLITLPRAPPTSFVLSAKKREHITVLGGGVTGHHDTISAISVSIVPTPTSAFSPAFSPAASPITSPSFNNPYSPPHFDSTSGWDILLASSSADTTGIIYLWRISLLPPARNSPLPVTFKPTSRPTPVFLHAPATSLAFNTAPTSISRRHHLLVSDHKGAVRILDTHTNAWLCNFYTPFSRTTDRRKKVLDCAWCTGGRGVIVLCGDGEWGIWDLEGVLSRTEAATVTGFLVGGVVGETWFNNRKSAHTQGGYGDDGASDISGRSPNSRAMSIASTATGTTAARRRHLNSARVDMTGGAGFLSVTPIPGSNFISTPSSLNKGKSSTMGGLQIADEIITLVFGATVLVLPSLRRFWQVEEAKIRKRAVRAGAGLGSGLWGGEDGRVDREFIVLEGWSTCGAVVTGMDVIPPGMEEGKEGGLARVLLGTACRVVVVDVKEPDAVGMRVSTGLGMATTPTATPATTGRRGGLVGRSGAGESAKGKRKVGFLQV